MIASSLWAFDALIRTPLTQTLSPLSIVMWEHLIGLLILSPLFVHSFRTLKKLTSKDVVFFLLLTLGSSIGGTLLFTYALSTSFATGDFITPLLLQKLQPVLVIALSAIFLKERIKPAFFFYASLALFGSYFMSFGLTTPSINLLGKELVVLYALGAATLWGSGTIVSKTVLKKFTVVDATFIRFLFAIPLAFLVSTILNLPIQTGVGSSELFRFVVIALSTGALGLLIYYYGLKKTPAHVATIAELIFPFTSIIIGITALNPYGAPQSLSPIQMIGIALLILGVWKVTRLSSSDKLSILIHGVVVKGNGDGTKLGFPTANLAIPHNITLPHGVYSAWATVQGKTYKSVLHFGPRLVFKETHPLFEVHILDFDQMIYGAEMKVELVTFIRGTQNFSSLKAMVTQIQQDSEDARKALQ